MVDEIRRAADIVQIIGEVVSLKKNGQNFFGVCPFHQEKSPSFSVSPGKQLFHCFGCKVGGDVFKFLQLYHGWDFPQALEEVAKRVGITVEKARQDPHREEGARILEAAGSLFQEVLASKEGQEHRLYLGQRKIPEELWGSFRLGAHPGGYHFMTERLREKGFSLELACQLGLLSRSHHGDFIDRFQGRLIFPIIDEKSKVKGFGARTLQNEQPKYLNSPKSSQFDKGRLFYGMHLAYRDISRKGYIVLVEGYLDVLALVQYGIPNVLGSMGTALTVDQIRLMKRWSHKVVSLYDADAAGVAATSRNLALFLKEGVESKVGLLPHGKDPDAFLHDTKIDEVEKKGLLRKVFEGAIPAVAYLTEKTVIQEANPMNKGKRLKELVDLLDQIPEEIERTMVKKELARRFDVSESLFFKRSAESQTVRSSAPQVQSEDQKGDRWEQEVIKYLVIYGHLHTRPLAELRGYLREGSPWGDLLMRLLEQGLEAPEIASLNWLSDASHEIQARTREWIISANPIAEAESLWKDLLKGLKRSYFKRESERLQNALSEAELKNDVERVRSLLLEKRDLVRLWKASEGSPSEMTDVAY